MQVEREGLEGKETFRHCDDVVRVIAGRLEVLLICPSKCVCMLGVFHDPSKSRVGSMVMIKEYGLAFNVAYLSRC